MDLREVGKLDPRLGGGYVYRTSLEETGLQVPSGHVFDIRGLTDEEINAHGCLTSLALYVCNAKKQGSDVAPTARGIAEIAAAVRVLGLLEMSHAVFVDYCVRRGLTGKGFEEADAFLERLLAICDAAAATERAREALRSARAASRAARVARHHEEAPAASEAARCSACGKKVAKVDGLCKRCAHAAGLMPHGKIGEG